MRLKLLFFPLSLFLFLVISIWMTKPQWDKFKDLKLELSKKNSELAEIKKGISSIGQSFSSYEEVNDLVLDLVGKALPEEPANDNLLAQINSSAKNSSIFLISTKIKEGKRKKTRVSKNEVPDIFSRERDFLVSLDLIGAYPDVKKFIANIESQNRFSSIKSLSISKADKMSKIDADAEDSDTVEDTSAYSDLVTAKISFNVYALPLDEKIQLSSLKKKTDVVFASLLNGEFKQDVIENYKMNVTDKIFPAVVSGNIGKVNLFAKERN